MIRWQERLHPQEILGHLKKKIYDQNKYAVRRGDFKMIIPWKGGDPQLYNLEGDIGEEQDIAGKHPETVQALDRIRLEWER